ncbi:ABC transporter permease [Pseudoprimorskyibacter insulae]|uniref:Aliphatic sulfonates transport permease protein SsuC n=1 Tax=Pseudoprimorskyibacter insulae TaxID=1695997 RepID=A0A2R8B091_9RHOB|nr:ABC transporter permease [Pseudoprimorskyibacter insulae]SPF81705.1 Putative aliphatic sulfonates transport permease protein SsuC [Pseudoprimorskyibacter insulae]
MQKDWKMVVVSLAGLIGLWAVLAWVKADPDVLPSPLAVLEVLIVLAQSGALWPDLFATLYRVAVSFGLAMVIGAALGVGLGLAPGLDRFFGSWVTVFLNLPALVLIVLCYLWIGLNEVAAITAVTLNKMAQVTVTLRDGTRARDKALDEMARTFGMGRIAQLRHILMPQLAPYFAIAGRNGLAMIWKIVLVVEFLGRSSGVGFRIHLYFQNFQTAHVLAYSLSFVAVMLLVEILIIQRWERAALRWRDG